MADTVERLAVLIEANTRSYTNAMAKLEKDTQRAIRNSTRAVAGLNTSLAAIGARARAVAGVFGVAFGARALVGLVKGAVDAGQATGDLAAKLGITAEQLQELGFAASQSGTDQEALAAGFRGLAKIMGEAERGSKTARAEFTAIGLSFDQLKGKSPDAVFKTLLDTIGRIRDPLQRAGELAKFFGKSGADLTQMALLGAAGLDTLTQRARDLGLVLSDADIAKLKDAGDKIDIIGTAGQTAGERMVVHFIPAIDAIAKLVTSQGFQQGLADTADKIGGIVKFFADHPDLAGALAGAAVGRFFGPMGMLVGAAVGSGDVIGPTGGAPGFHMLTADERAGHPQVGLVPGSPAPPLPPAINIGDRGGRPPVVPHRADPEAKLAGAHYDLEQSTKASTERLQAFNAAMQDVGSQAFDAFDSIVTGSKSASDALKQLLLDLVKAEAKSLFLGGLPGGGGGGGPLTTLLSGLFGGMRAGGGDVSAGKLYGVGERGPELFVPRTPGRIVANGNGWGGGAPAEVVVHVQASDYFDARVVRVSGQVSAAVVHRNNKAIPGMLGTDRLRHG